MARIGEIGAEPLADLALDLVRHEIAAVRIGADRHRLRLERAQPRAFAGADIGLERGLVLALVGRLRGGRISRPSAGRASFSVISLEAALVRVDRRVELRDLLLSSGRPRRAARSRRAARRSPP